MHLKYVQQQKNNFEIENQISKLKTIFRRIQRQNILLIEISVSEKYNSYTVPENPSMFTLAQIEFIIKQLKESNVAGNDSLTYSLIKNATTPTFKIFLLKFFNYFITLNKLPSKLNQSIIKPIIKDQKKSTNDTNNIRPISISNCLSQIFEKTNTPELPRSS
jgi:hypothetical protein